MCVKFNREAIEDKVVRLARWLDLRTPTFDGFMQWTLDLRREVGIPHTLAELGVKIEHLDKLSEMAAVDPTAGGNPIKVGVAGDAQDVRGGREREVVMVRSSCGGVLPTSAERHCRCMTSSWSASGAGRWPRSSESI